MKILIINEIFDDYVQKKNFLENFKAEFMSIFHIIDNQRYFFQSHEDGNNLEKIKVKKKNRLEVNSACLSIIMKYILDLLNILLTKSKVTKRVTSYPTKINR
jgi:hypothetical protein